MQIHIKTLTNKKDLLKYVTSCIRYPETEIHWSFCHFDEKVSPWSIPWKVPLTHSFSLNLLAFFGKYFLTTVETTFLKLLTGCKLLNSLSEGVPSSLQDDKQRKVRMHDLVKKVMSSEFLFSACCLFLYYLVNISTLPVKTSVSYLVVDIGEV